MIKPKGTLNAFFPELEGIDLQAVDHSHVFFPINGPLSLTGTIRTYDPESGRMQVNADWDIKKTVQLNAWARYQGRPSSEIPLRDEVVVGSPVLLHRVGDFNSPGSGKPGGYELRTRSSSKVSWVAFFFPRIPAVPIDIWGSGKFKKKSLPSGYVVRSARDSKGSTWMTTGIKPMLGHGVFRLPGSPFRPIAFDKKQILCLSSDNISPDRSTRITCDGGGAGIIYSIQVVSGEIIKGESKEDCLIYYGPGRLKNFAICCPGSSITDIPSKPVPQTTPLPEPQIPSAQTKVDAPTTSPAVAAAVVAGAAVFGGAAGLAAAAGAATELLSGLFGAKSGDDFLPMPEPPPMQFSEGASTSENIPEMPEPPHLIGDPGISPILPSIAPPESPAIKSASPPENFLGDGGFTKETKAQVQEEITNVQPEASLLIVPEIRASFPGSGTSPILSIPTLPSFSESIDGNYITLPVELGSKIVYHVTSDTSGGKYSYYNNTDINNQAYVFFAGTPENPTFDEYWVYDKTAGVETWWQADSNGNLGDVTFNRFSGTGGGASGNITDFVHVPALAVDGYVLEYLMPNYWRDPADPIGRTLGIFSSTYSLKLNYVFYYLQPYSITDPTGNYYLSPPTAEVKIVTVYEG